MNIRQKTAIAKCLRSYADLIAKHHYHRYTHSGLKRKIERLEKLAKEIER